MYYKTENKLHSEANNKLNRPLEPETETSSPPHKSSPVRILSQVCPHHSLINLGERSNMQKHILQENRCMTQLLLLVSESVSPEKECSSPHSPETATGSCPEPGEPNSHPPASLHNISSNPFPPFMPRPSKWTLFTGFPTKSFCTSNIPYMCAIRPAHFILLDSICLIISVHDYKVWSSALCNYSIVPLLHPR
jgi:hypothetical protein